MDFNSAISFANKAPEGWKEKLTLDEYAKLEDERKQYYKPLFAKYRTKKVRDYDLDTGKYVGWKETQVGIGEPTGYEYVGYFTAKMIDDILNSNVLMQRIMGKWE